MEGVNQISERAKQRILMAIVITCTDRDGLRLIDPFMKLPPQDEFPHYFQVIKTPMDVETISSKIETDCYSDLNALERDFIQMCYNAQLYNAEDSVIFRESIVLQKLFVEEKTRIQLEQQNRKVVQKVFGQELLREIILDYVLHDKKVKKTHYDFGNPINLKTVSNIRSCRLVSKDWLRSTSRVLLKCHQPIFRFSFYSSKEKQIGDTIDGFVSTVSGPSRLSDRVPPFIIRGDADILFQEVSRRQSFFNCLEQCGSGLVELRLSFANVGLFMLDANSWLPKLRTFKVYISRESSGGSNHIVFIQSVLNACQEFKSFRIEHGMHDHNYLPQTLLFPSSMTELTIRDWLPDVEALKNNLVPTLRILKLQNIQIPLEDGLLTSILEKVRKTLERFYLSFTPTNKKSEVQPLQPMTFRIPLMEKLEILEMGDEHLELEQTFSSLEKLVPVLTRMHLFSQTISSFLKWTDRSCFHSVTSLYAHLSSLELDSRGLTIEINFDHRTMENMKRAFPNLQELEIRMIDTDTSLFFEFVMKEMRHLRVLRICALDGNIRWSIVHPQFWDTLFLGIPLESVSALKKSPELWEDLRKTSTASIRNLTDLHTLHLTGLFDDDKVFALSAEVFQCAFLEMPNLTEVVLDHGFRVSKEMKQTWRKQGRLIKTNPWESDEEET